MFDLSLISQCEHESRFRQRHLLQERPAPDSSWLGGRLLDLAARLRLVQVPREAKPPGVPQDLLVPDDRLGLMLVDGQPVRCLGPGRHRIPAGRGRVEVRLIVPGSASLQEALDQPFERAFRFLDGSLVEILVSPQA